MSTNFRLELTEQPSARKVEGQQFFQSSDRSSRRLYKLQAKISGHAVFWIYHLSTLSLSIFSVCIAQFKHGDFNSGYEPRQVEDLALETSSRSTLA